MGADATRRCAGKGEGTLYSATGVGWRRSDYRKNNTLTSILSLRERRTRTQILSATIQTLEPAERPPTTMSSRLDGELLEISMGPQHPSTHGVFRMNVALEGEIV